MSDPADQTRFIARYRLSRQLGSGGMGEVFVAEDTKLGLSRPMTSPKKLPVGNPSWPKLKPPLLSTTLMASLPKASRSWPCNQLQGQTLDALVRQLQFQEIAGIRALVAGALETARQHEVVHRDVRPGDVMVDGHAVLNKINLFK